MVTKILVVDDDKNICDLLRMYLEKEGYEVKTASDGVEGVTAFRMYEPDMVLLDIMMPKKDGWQVCREIREHSSKPIIMITAKGEEADKVEGLECGADDYVTKPFGMMELIARVKAVIRRCAGRGEGVLTLGGIRLDREKHTVEADGKEVVLTFREFELLRYLMEHPEKAFDRDRLLDEVWGAEYEGGPRTVDMHVQTIRKKLGRCASQIETIYGLGYKIGEGNVHAQ